MIQLIIAFLISLGFHLSPEKPEAVIINQQEGQKYYCITLKALEISS